MPKISIALGPTVALSPAFIPPISNDGTGYVAREAYRARVAGATAGAPLTPTAGHPVTEAGDPVYGRTYTKA